MELPKELLDELKKISRGFICINKMENKIRIFLLEDYVQMLIWEGCLICKMRKFKEKLKNNPIISSYMKED